MSRLSHQDFISFKYRKLCLENATVQLTSCRSLQSLLPITVTSSCQAPDFLSMLPTPIPPLAHILCSRMVISVLTYHALPHCLMHFDPSSWFYAFINRLRYSPDSSVLYHLELPPDLSGSLGR